MKSSKNKLFVLIVNAVIVVVLIAIYIVSCISIDVNNPKESKMFKDFYEIDEMINAFENKKTLDFSNDDNLNGLSYSRNINYVFSVDEKKVFFYAFEFDSPSDAQKYFCKLTGSHYTESFKETLTYQSVKYFIIKNSAIRIVLYNNYLYYVKSNNIKSFYKAINIINEHFSIKMDMYP